MRNSIMWQLRWIESLLYSLGLFTNPYHISKLDKQEVNHMSKFSILLQCSNNLVYIPPRIKEVIIS